MEVLKTTQSVCPTCLTPVPAQVVRRGPEIHMLKSCAEHGDFEVRLAASAERYYLSRGAGCCGKTEQASRFESLSTCIALIEVVDDCNLACPTCYADSPRRGHDDSFSGLSLQEAQARIGAVLERKGKLDILQLSGGEPTLHPQFVELLGWCTEHPQIGYVLVNTNGVRIARDDEFLRELGTLRRRPAGFELYLQYDGPQQAGQLELRGVDLRRVREDALRRAGEQGIPTTLAMTVTRSTLPHVGEALRCGLDNPWCRGITFQPATDSGRMDSETQLGASPISVGDLVAELAERAPELVSERTFTPLPCGDPNCHSIGYLLRTEAGVQDLAELVSYADYSDFLGERVDYSLEDLQVCGCETEPLGQLLHAAELGKNAPFRLFIKPFMSAWTYDQDRIDRCCTHVITEDGQLDSFCHHYLQRSPAGARRHPRSLLSS